MERFQKCRNKLNHIIENAEMLYFKTQIYSAKRYATSKNYDPLWMKYSKERNKEMS